MHKVALISFDRVPSSKGASQHILSNARHLRDAGHDVSLISLGPNPLLGWRHLPVSLSEPNWLRRALAFRERVRETLDEHDFDVHHVRSPWEGLAVPAHKKLIYEVNGLPSIELPHRFPSLARNPPLIERLQLQELALIDRADALVTPSSVTRDHLIALGAEPRAVHVVPNAPSFSPLSPGDPLRPPRPDHQPLRLCYIGTLHDWQGLPAFLRVLPAISSPWHLTILTGDHPHRRARLSRRLAKLGLLDHVSILDPVDHDTLKKILAAQDIGLAPLTPCARNLIQGCMPIKLLDYMAAGLPVFAPEMKVSRAILGDDVPLYRRHGRLAMTDALLSLIADPGLRARIAADGLARVARFSTPLQASKLLDVYDAVLP